MPPKEEQLRTLLNNERALCQRMKDNYSLLKDKYADLQRDYGELTDNYTRLTKDAETKQKEHDALVQRLSGELADKVAFLGRMEAESRESFAVFKRELSRELKDAHRAVIVSLSAQRDRLSAENAQLKVKAAENRAATLNAKSQLAALNDRLSAVQTSGSQLFETERSELLARIEELNKGNCALNETITSLHAFRTKFGEAERQLKLEVAKGEDLLQSQSTEREEWRTKLRELTAARDGLIAENQRLEGRFRLNAKEVAEGVRENEVLKRQVRNLTEELADAKSAVAIAVCDVQRDFQRRIAELELENNHLLEETIKKSTNPQSPKLTAQSVLPSTSTREPVVEHEDNVKLRGTLAEPMEVQRLHEELEQLRQNCANLKFRLKEETQQSTFKSREWQFERDRYEKEIASQRKRLMIANESSNIPEAERISSLKMELHITRQQLKANELKLNKAKSHYSSLLKRLKRVHKKVLQRYKSLNQAYLFENNIAHSDTNNLNMAEITAELDLISARIRATKQDKT